MSSLFSPFVARAQPDQYSRVDANGWAMGQGLVIADYGDAPVNPTSW